MSRHLSRAILVSLLAAQAAACAAWPVRGGGLAPVGVVGVSPAATETPSASPSPSVTSSPSPTATLHPLTIESMRQREYPGSEITIEETLTSGANYARYIASYRSDGLKIYALLTVPYGQPPAAGWPVIIFNHG
ncbi:MAG: peptidase, partial [Anaerolineales bacterium]